MQDVGYLLSDVWGCSFSDKTRPLAKDQVLLNSTLGKYPGEATGEAADFLCPVRLAILSPRSSHWSSLGTWDCLLINIKGCQQSCAYTNALMHIILHTLEISMRQRQLRESSVPEAWTQPQQQGQGAAGVTNTFPSVTAGAPFMTLTEPEKLPDPAVPGHYTPEQNSLLNPKLAIHLTLSAHIIWGDGSSSLFPTFFTWS